MADKDTKALRDALEAAKRGPRKYGTSDSAGARAAREDILESARGMSNPERVNPATGETNAQKYLRWSDEAGREAAAEERREARGMKKGGMTASKRADGIAQKGKTRGTIVMCGGGMYKK